MKAVRIHSYGHSDQIRVEENVPRPELKPNEVLIQIRDAGVNPIDWKIREGYLKERMPSSFPLTLGQDCSGEIVEVGAGVKKLKVGDEVFGFAHGSYAEFATATEDSVALKPEKVDFATAASIPTAGLAAWQLVVDIAKIQQGQSVLIHGAAGGVGSFAVQLAKWKGADVFATAAAEDMAYLKQIGAKQVIDYQKEKFEDKLRDVDVVLDLVGGAVLARSYSVLKKKTGLIISTVGAPDENALKKIGAKGVRFVEKRDSNELSQLASLIEQGKLQARIDEVLPLDEARKAQDLLQKGDSHGKIVLEVM